MRARRHKAWRLAGWTLVLGALFLVGIGFAPRLLAWPYQARRGDTRIYATAPIPPQIDEVLARADALLARSPIHAPGPRVLLLTGGGWRWNLLALATRGAFAFRRPFSDAIVVNASDVAADRVANGAAVGGKRTLSEVIAHETTHIDVARRYGEVTAALLPTWKSEGYADHVAGASSLSDADYRRLRAQGARPPAMAYYEARRRVEAALAADGDDVDALMR